MATITRGTIKSYDSGTHRAAVQPAGSLAVWLQSVAVSAAIEPPEVVAGRECAVLLLTDDDPEDACVVSIHNAVPYGTGRLRDVDGDTRVEVERTPDEDKVAVTVAGTLRYLVQAVTPHHQLTGDVQISGHAAAGVVSPIAGAVLRLEDSTAGPTNLDGVQNLVRGASGATGSLRGVTGEVQVQSGAGAMTWARGLEFRVTHSGANTISDMYGAQVLVDGVGPATNRVAVWAEVLALDTTSTLRAGVVARLAPSVTATYPTWRSFLSRVNLLRSTITDLYHYALENATVALGAAITRVHGYYSPNLTVGADRRPFWDDGIGGLKNDASGNRFRSNTAFGTNGTATLFGQGDGVIHIAPATTVPTVNPGTGHILYVNGAGQLVSRGSAGTITVLAVP
jgi:hypothetical protein